MNDFVDSGKGQRGQAHADGHTEDEEKPQPELSRWNASVESGFQDFGMREIRFLSRNDEIAPHPSGSMENMNLHITSRVR